MATVKSYTDLEQSKKLSEFLPIESADIFYWCADHYPKEDWIIEVGTLDDNYECICAWSLAALLEVLPYPTLYQQGDGAWGLDAWVEQVKPYSIKNAICEVDACVEMILKLHELNLL